MFALFQTFVFIWLTKRVQTTESDGVPKVAKIVEQFPCLICEDEQQQDGDEQEDVNIGTLFEYDKSMGTDNLDEIENEVLLINSTTWLQEPTNAKSLKDEVKEFREMYNNRSLSFEEADNKLETLKAQTNAYALEKDANKRNALKKWRRLPVVRLRVHKIEQRILDADIFGENIQALEHIDEIRVLANEASKALRDVYNYYFQMDSELLESNEILNSIEQKLNDRRSKEGRFRGSKCFWIFCY